MSASNWLCLFQRTWVQLLQGWLQTHFKQLIETTLNDSKNGGAWVRCSFFIRCLNVEDIANASAKASQWNADVFVSLKITVLFRKIQFMTCSIWSWSSRTKSIWSVCEESWATTTVGFCFAARSRLFPCLDSGRGRRRVLLDCVFLKL
jgi:hypothetical protein